MTALPACDPAVVALVRAALALLFASAAWHKLRDLRAFGAALAAYRVLPAALVTAVAAGVALLESGVAVGWIAALAAPGIVALAAPAIAALVLPTTVGLLAAYCVAIAVNLLRGRRTIDCGCGIGGAAQPIGEWLLVRNAALVATAFVAARPAAVRPLVWVDALTIAGGLTVATAVWLAAHGLAAAAARAARVAGAAR